MFAQEIAEEVLKPGRVGILVDRPPISSDQALTVAQAETLGLRPTMQKYEASSIINWKYGRVNNAYVLVMVVLAESSAVGEEEFRHTLQRTGIESLIWLTVSTGKGCSCTRMARTFRLMETYFLK